MRVLITGVSGFVGGRLAKRLANRDGVKLFGFSRSLPVELEPCVSWRSVDLADRAAVIDYMLEVNPDRVVHLAALAHPGDCRLGPERAFEMQVTGTAAMLSALSPEASALIVSSAQVYGSHSASPIPETAELNADSPYGRSKRASEQVALAAAASGKRVIIARPFNHSGSGQQRRYVLPAFASRVLESRRTGEPITTGNLFPRRDFLHVEDVLDAYELLLEKGVSGEVYNVASGVGVSIEELLSKLQNLAGTELEVRQDPARMRANDPEEICGDAARLRALGWSPRFSLDDLLREVLKAVSISDDSQRI